MKKAGVVLLGSLVLGTVAVAGEVPPPTAIAPAVNEVLGTGEQEDEEGSSLNRRFKGGSIRITGTRRVLIRGIDSLPSLSLSAQKAAANPLVLVDGVLLEGGLNMLLAREPLDIQGIGYSEDPTRFGDFGEDVGRGIVLIDTVKGEGWPEGSREAWARGKGAWEQREEVWQRRVEEWKGRVEEWKLRTEADQDRIETTTVTVQRAPPTAEEAEQAGWVVIRNIDGKPSLWLSPASVAANPRVVIDGVVLDGGLDALLKGEPLHMEKFGYLGPDRGVFIITKR